MEQILNHIFNNDSDLVNESMEILTDLRDNNNLKLQGGTRCWIKDKYVYNFIFEDTSDIASIDLPIHEMHREEQIRFRTRQNNRATLLYRFIYLIMDEIPADIELSDLTNDIILITCTIS